MKQATAAMAIICGTGVLFLMIRSGCFKDYGLQLFTAERMFTRAIIGGLIWFNMPVKRVHKIIATLGVCYCITYNIFMLYIFTPISHLFNGISYAFNLIWLIIGLSLCVYLYLNRNRV